MNDDVISREILGAPVMVTIGKREHPLTFPAHNIFLYRQLTGDSLFKFDTWRKIDFEENYEAWLSCLWAGLHAQQPADAEHKEPFWKAPYSRAELEQLIGFANAAMLHAAMVQSLTAWMPREKKSPAELQPATAQPVVDEKEPTTTSSQVSGSELAVASD